MDLIEQVREVGADIGDVEERSVRIARVALARETAHAARPRRKHVRAWAGIGIGGLVAGAAVTAIVVGSVVAPPAAPSASAAEVLNDAADVAISGGDWQVPAGEYLRVTSTSEWLTLWDVDMPEPWARFNNGAPADADAGWVNVATQQLFVPSDRAGEWVQVLEPAVRGESFGERIAEAEKDYLEQGPSDGGPTAETRRALGGSYKIPDGQDGEGTITVDMDARQIWNEMPSGATDTLIAWWRALVGESADSAASDSSIVEAITDDATLALAPVDVRARLFRVLAGLDGSRVDSVDGNITTIRFDWKTKWWSAWKLISIDTTRGAVVGITSSGAILPEKENKTSGIPEWGSRRTYEYTIVDSAP